MQLDLLTTEHEESRPKGPAVRKLYYSISEVAERVGVPAHVLRYWESEFPSIHPKKGKGGNRLYQERDVKLLEQIRVLLYEQKFTIAGARAQLGSKPAADEQRDAGSGAIEDIKRELKEILTILNR